MKLNIYSDGASRGNPGFSALAFIIVDEEGRILRRHSKYLGVRTNNQAEYEALIAALSAAHRLTSKEVLCYSDSKLMVEQLKGNYLVRDLNLRVLWVKAKRLQHRFQRTNFIYVSRDNPLIQQVDKLANQELNQVNTSI